MTNNDRIQPYSANPFYWQYKGQPVLLLGGSVEDNLFQIKDITSQLDQLQAAGGNYVRCTMSSRDAGDAWPFEQEALTDLYDLNQPGQDYWGRFAHFLQLATERDIILQIELWDRFDYARGPWLDNPYNPKNNIHYTSKESGLPIRCDSHPSQRESCFFRTVPSLENNELLLRFQHAQVDKLLELALPYGNVLYCIDNETNEDPAWPEYWTRYLKYRANEAGVSIYVTEMWDAWDLNDPMHEATFAHPELYDFVDVSQNNHNPPDHHWQNLLDRRQKIAASGYVRPMNNVKIYGANTGRYGTNRDAQERMWRNVFAGLASSRFHRPPSGQGLNPVAQAHLRALRMITDEMNIFACTPHNDLLSNHSTNEAFCTANPVFFPDGGNILLDASAISGNMLTIRWLDIRANHWLGGDSAPHVDNGLLHLVTPEEEGYWAVLVQTM
ncbi:hypothetical protein ACFLYO_10700 [Chloroflexota bacterium]